MRLLIDGYNLLHATDLFGAGEAAGTLEGSREALLAFLVGRLTARERRAAVIVFDAVGAPPGLPDRYTVEGLSVRFARGYADADSLLEELIELCRGPKKLTVVSSDHRVQRAARRRGAAYVDSATWHGEMRRRADGQAAETPTEKTDPGDAASWVERFADPDLLDEVRRQEEEFRRRAAPPPPSPGADNRSAKKPKKPPRQPFGEGILDPFPFPPGYADDLADQLKPPDDDPPG